MEYVPRILVDFDNTICSDINVPPSKECLEVLELFQQRGYIICIFSVRSNSEETNKKDEFIEMLEYLKKYNIPYHEIDYHKVHCKWIIDDRCFGIAKIPGTNNVDWNAIKEKIGS